MLGVCAAVCAAMCVFLRKLKLKQWYKILMWVGIVSETVKVFTYILRNEQTYGGYLPKTDLPFHLCSIQLIFIALLNFTHSEKLHRVLLAFMMPSCLVGGLAAILIPTSSSLTIPVITVQYFMYHTVIVAFAIYLFYCREIEWTAKDWGNALKMLCFLTFVAIYVNSICYDVVEFTNVDGVKTVEYVSRVNFMYVVDPPVEGLPFLNKNHGWLVYFAHLAFTGLTAVTLCYIKPVVKAIKNRGKKASAASGALPSAHAGTLPDAPVEETNVFAENKANN